jgi:hypothetical protein
MARVFATALLLAFALPGAAQNKQYHVVFPATVPSGNGVQITVAVSNTSPPPGLSTINSMQFVAPNGVTIVEIDPGNISSSNGGQTVTLKDFPGIRRGETKSFTFTLNVTGSTCTPGEWGVQARTGNAFPQGDTFFLNGSEQLVSAIGCTGILKCPSLPATVPGIYNFSLAEDGNLTTGVRLENKDGSACVPVPFNVSFTDIGRSVNIYWDETSQPFAVLDTTVEWPAETVDPATNLPRSTKVDWGDGVVDAPTCLASNAPAPYGTLTAAVAPGATSFQLTAASGVTTLPPAPFPIVVASVSGPPERMLVTSWSGPVGGTFTVQVAAATVSSHASGAKAMSTPLPVMTSGPLAGKQAEVCIVQETFTTPPFGNATCTVEQTANVEPLACVLVKSRLFLIGDPIVSRSI